MSTQSTSVQPLNLLLRGLAFIAISFLTAVALGAHAAADSADTKALDGSWVPVTAELGGAPMREKIVKAILLKIHKGEYEVTIEGGPGVDRGRCAVDTASNPKAMKITGVAGPNAGKTFPAIYEVDGDTLRICDDLSGAKRP
ncbi:MAG: TIGR03067 domain-containing protein, partial [Limisphaerales bacterium]